MINRLFFLLALGLVFAGCSEDFNLLKTIEAGYINPMELKSMMDDKESFILIDLRPSIQYRNAHIAGAINIPHQELTDRLKRYNQVMTIIVYGDNNSTQRTSLEKIQSLGFTDVRMLRGGFGSWTYGVERE